MKQLFNLIQINHNFRKSVNLELDLEDYERIGGYIPTRSSVAILQRYFECVSGRNSENVTFLIGPYGKGKSHLLLVLLAMLHGEQDKIADVVDKIAKIDANINENTEGKEETVLQLYMKNGFPKYLPVLINSNARNNLNESFIFALQEALKRDGLDAIAPESYYTAALEIIDNWKKNFKSTYQNLEKILDVRELRRELEAKNPAVLEEFKRVYPQLTSGSHFAPMIQTDAKAVYNEVNRILTTQYDYSGIFIVFDEFSKYLEGHPVEGFSNDMKALQDMCELCNAAKGEIIMTMVAHKSIHDYTRSIDEAVKNTFRGIEGRVREFEFIVTAQNNYELIADTIVKKEPTFSKEFAKLLKEDEVREFLEESYALACFTSIFQWEEFVETIGKGCFPMTPVCAYALLHISERVAQNERTIFTFLSDEGQGSLSWLLAKEQGALIGIDKIYDYFKTLFRETADQPQIHNEWQKAEYAISKTKDVLEIQILKAIALIRMIHREDELPARDNVLRLALAVPKDAFDKAIAGLMEKNLITYRSSQGLYAFRANVGVDVDKRIEKKMEELRNRFVMCDSLKKISEFEYELPKKYNQKYAITRYFQYEYMEKADFLKLTNSQYLFEEKFADGKIIVLAHIKKSDKKEIQAHLEQLQDGRIVILANETPVVKEELLLKYEAVEALKTEAISLIKEGIYVEENEILIQELGLYEEDLAFELNAALEQDYLPENCNVTILANGRKVKCKNSVEFNALLSEICEEYYGFSPRVNHELLNIEVVGAQYLKARNAVISNLLEEKDCSSYLTGTNPESMVYRAAFVHTKTDAGCQRIFDEIGVFFNSCAGKKQAFAKLYACLQGEKYGTRKGIIPLFLAKKLADSEGTAVIYLKNKELEVTAETLNNVNAFPEKYELFIEPKAAEKDRYLKQLEKAFCEKGSFALSKQSRINGIIACMQKWYRSLPQYAMVTTDYPKELQDTVATLKNQLRRAEVNPRELLFDKIPSGLKEEKYDVIVDKVLQAQTLMNGKLSMLIEEVAGEVKKMFGVSKEASLKACLVEWYQNQSKASKNHILSTSVSSLMNYLETLSTNDEEAIVSKLSRIVLDMYIEDWNDTSKEQFLEELARIREEIESIHEKESSTSNKSRLILQDAQGNEIAKYYDADVSDSTSVYLQNMIDEALEDFGDTLEMNQKVAVLVQAIEKLLQQ